MTDPVCERCDELCLLAEQLESSAADKANIAAVIKDYDEGMAIPVAGNAVLHPRGKRMTEAIPLEGLSIIDKITEFNSIDPEGHGGRVLVETIQDPKFQLAAAAACPCTGSRDHNTVRPHPDTHKLAISNG